MRIAVLLPHMDDEVFILPYLVDLRKQNSCNVSIYFLTKSEGRDARFDQNVRETESRNSIVKILPTAEIVFLGRELEVKDLELHNHFLLEFEHLRELLNNKCDVIVSPYFEGGHIDHDSSCILAFELAKVLQCNHLTFNAYSARYKSRSFYKVAKPIENLASKVKVPIRSAVYIHTLFIPARYKSQLMTWLGLYLPLVWRTLVLRRFSLYLDVEFDFNAKPNFARILYENRGDAIYSKWNSSAKDFLDSIKHVGRNE